MNAEIVVAICSFAGTAIGSFSGLRLMSYRIEQLEKRVDKHNSVVERTYILEEQMKVTNHRLTDLETAERSRGT